MELPPGVSERPDTPQAATIAPAPAALADDARLTAEHHAPSRWLAMLTAGFLMLLDLRYEIEEALWIGIFFLIHLSKPSEVKDS